MPFRVSPRTNGRRISSLIIVVLLLGTASGVLIGSVGAETTSPQEQQWAVELGGDIAAAPAVDEGRLYVSNGSAVTAVDTRSGTVRWSRSLSGRVLYPPTVTAGIVTVVDETGTLHAMTASTGAGNSTYQTAGTPKVAINDAGDTAYLLDESGTLHAVNLRTREAHWRTNAGTGAKAVAIADGHVITLDQTGTVSSYNSTTGARHWQRTAQTANGVALAGGQQTVGILWANGTVESLGAAEGQRQWQVTLPTGATPDIDGTVVTTHGIHYIATAAGDVHAVVNGTYRWTQTVPRTGALAPTITPARGDILIGTDAGTLVNIDAWSGRPLWNVTMPGTIVGTPAVGEYIYVGDSGGTLHAIEPQTVALTLNTTTKTIAARGQTVTATVQNTGEQPLTRQIRLTTETQTIVDTRELTPGTETIVTFDGIKSAHSTVTVGAVREMITTAPPETAYSHGHHSSKEPATTQRTTVYIPPEAATNKTADTTPGFGLLSTVVGLFILMRRQQGCTQNRDDR